MKYLICMTATFLFSFSPAISQESSEDFEWVESLFDDDPSMKGSTLLVDVGTVLVYGVDFYGNHYDFVVTFTGFENGGVQFEYEMTNDANTKGSVIISGEAFESAHAQNNYFKGGPMSLNDATTVILSKAVYQELLNNGQSEISVDEGMTWLILERKNYAYDYTATIKGVEVSDLNYMLATDDNSVTYKIHLKDSFPLILMMDLGWKIWLKEVK